ncbi:calcium-responsive transcription factor isoform 2-T4 [Pluvialis apricaria]
MPAWARRLRNCEKIGDSYRGYCVSEAELESVLTLHKQQTQSVWGTRQSPSPAKPATRLMWKSQYVPYDGIPFVNAGSRAIVMECQYGPRRKGFQPKKAGEQEGTSGHLYKATCPARIYIKKVQKFPEYRVPTDPKIDKKIIRMEQEKAFNMLKKNLIDAGGVLRWYVQLPTQQAHQYHEMETSCLPSSPSHFSVSSPEEEEEVVRDENCTLPSRLHPQVADKIRELVSQGIEQVYAVRKQLRKYVERELFKPDEVPERHNLSFFPTVNDIKNHIHEVQKSLRNGEMVYNSESIPATLQWTTDSGNVLTETVTVTFASPASDGSSVGESVVTKSESNQSGESLLPETAQLLSSLSSLQPKIFAQLQGLQLQSTFTSTNGSTALIAVNNHSPPSPASLLDSIGSAISNHSLVLSQGHSLQAGAGLTEHSAAASAFGTLPGSDQSLVTMGQLVAVGGVDDSRSLEGGVHQILLGDVQTIPVRIVDSHPALSQKLSSRSIQQDSTKLFFLLAHSRSYTSLRAMWRSRRKCIRPYRRTCRNRTDEIKEQEAFQTVLLNHHVQSLKGLALLFLFVGDLPSILQITCVQGLPQKKNSNYTTKLAQDHLPLRVLQITNKRPEWRTEEEAKFVKSCLQEIESCQSYSSRLQFLLAEVVHFKCALVIFCMQTGVATCSSWLLTKLLSHLRCFVHGRKWRKWKPS